MWPWSSTALAVAQDATSDSHVQTRDALTDSAPVGVRPPRRSDTASAVTVDQALSLATSYRCVSLLSTMVSGLTLYAERGGKPMASVPALLRRPSLDEPLRDTIALTVTSMATVGESFWMLVRSGPGDAVGSIVVLDPRTVEIDIDPNTGAYNYRRLVAAGGRWVPFPAWQRAHLRLLKLPGKPHGLGPIQAGQAELRGAIDLRDYAAHWFRDSSAAPKDAWLSTDQPLSKTEVDQYRTQLERLKEDGRVPVFGNGVRLNLSHLTPQEALWIEAQSHYSATVARLFGIPTTLLDERSGGSEVYSNQLDKRQALLTQTLTAYTAEIESAFTAILPGGQSAKFDTSTLFMADQGSATAKDNSVVTTTDTNTAPVDQATGGSDA